MIIMVMMMMIIIIVIVFLLIIIIINIIILIVIIIIIIIIVVVIIVITIAIGMTICIIIVVFIAIVIVLLNSLFRLITLFESQDQVYIQKKSIPPTAVMQIRLSVVSLGRLGPASFAVLTRKRREDHPGSVNETDVISGLVML